MGRRGGAAEEGGREAEIAAASRRINGIKKKSGCRTSADVAEDSGFLHHAEIIRITGKSYRLRQAGRNETTGAEESKPANPPIGSDDEDAVAKPANAPIGSKRKGGSSKPANAPIGSGEEK